MRAALPLALLALAGAAAGEPPPLTGRDVASHQTIPDPQRFFPRSDRPGRVDLLCAITAEGALADCQVQLEEPQKHGFAAATLKIAAVTRVDATAYDGSPTAGRKFLFAMRFGAGGPRP